MIGKKMIENFNILIFTKIAMLEEKLSNHFKEK